jgi:SAM-dependent methyltransferase
MNFSHSGVTDWGLRHVGIERDFKILEVGCGGGRTIEKLAELAPDGMVDGIDYADGSVAASRGKNAKLLKEGRVALQQASVSQLPFAENTFDGYRRGRLSITGRTCWEICGDLGVLRPGGTLIVIAESYKKGANEVLQRPVMKLLRSTNLSVDEQRELFAAAGYNAVEIFEERSKGWICGTGTKPMPLK